MRLTNEIEILPEANDLLITRNGTTTWVKVENQLMQVLVLLAESRGQVVDKQQFIDKIWAGNELSGETALTKNIFRLRELLKKNGIEDKIQIETISKKGYRLMLHDTSAPSKGTRTHEKPILIGALAFLIMVLLIYLVRGSERNQGPTMEVVGNDTVIHLGDDKVRAIEIK